MGKLDKLLIENITSQVRLLLIRLCSNLFKILFANGTIMSRNIQFAN